MQRLRIRAGGLYFSRGLAAQQCAQQNRHATQASLTSACGSLIRVISCCYLWSYFTSRGPSIFLEKSGRSSSNAGYKIQKVCGRKIFLRTRTFGAPGSTQINRIFEAKDGTTCMNVLNTIERHNFCLNNLLTKSNRTELQTFNVKERSFGALCIGKSFKTPPVTCR